MAKNKNIIVLMALLLVLVMSFAESAEARSFPITAVEGSYAWLMPANDNSIFGGVISWGNEDGFYATAIAAFLEHFGVNFPM